MDSHPAVQAEVLLPAATDHPGRIDHPQAAVTPLALHQEAPAVTPLAEVHQVHILPAVQAVVIQVAPTAEDHPEVLVVPTAEARPEAQAAPTAVAAVQEAAEEEGNH